MNKYIIPICDIDKGEVWIKVIIAKSTNDCQEKLIQYIIDTYDIDDRTTSYKEFIKFIDSEHNILIGRIKDIEEL